MKTFKVYVCYKDGTEGWEQAEACGECRLAYIYASRKDVLSVEKVEVIK